MATPYLAAMAASFSNSVMPPSSIISRDASGASPIGRTASEADAVAVDSGNGISAALDFKLYLFVNCDLTINHFRRPAGEWICLQSASWFGGNGCGLAESALYDETGFIGRASQSLAVRRRSP